MDDYVSYADWRYGPTDVRFMPYLQADSVYKDPIDGKVGRREWADKFVIVAPVVPAAAS
jgi:hypothetical protein